MDPVPVSEEECILEKRNTPAITTRIRTRMSDGRRSFFFPFFFVADAGSGEAVSVEEAADSVLLVSFLESDAGTEIGLSACPDPAAGSATGNVFRSMDLFA